MKFKLKYDDSEEEAQFPWSWSATVPDDGVDVTIAVSPTIYGTEKAARSAIAKARKAFSGAKFAKVVYFDAEEE